MIVYIENSKDSTQKLLEVINEFSKVAGCNINTQKFDAFLSLTMKYQKEDVKKKSHLKLHKEIPRNKPN